MHKGTLSFFNNEKSEVTQSTVREPYSTPLLGLGYFKGKTKKAKTSFGKHVYRKVPGVRIPLSPPKQKSIKVINFDAF